MPLHWSTDPLLYDEEPISYNEWITANSLIEQGLLDQVITTDLSFSNLYGIMVRKVDFVRVTSRDRIIARFPFLLLEEQEITILKKDILNLAEVVRDYFYRSINKSILKWQEVIQNYLQKGVLPYPIYRCSFELTHERYNKSYTSPSLRFQSARGEAFTFPTKLTTKLAYLCGVCNGDGNLRDYWLIIVDETKEHINRIQSILGELFNKKGKIMQVSGAWAIKLNLLWSVRLLNFLTEQSINQPKYDTLKEPLIFKHFKGDFRIDYWRGMMDSDGSYSKYAINLTTASEQLKNDFSQFLSDNSIGHNYSVITYPNSQVENYIVYLLANSHLDFCKLIGSNHPKKKNDLEVLLSRKEKQQNNDRIVYLDESRLTPEGYFDYSHTPKLQLFLGDYIKRIRKIPLTEFSKKVKISRSSLYLYERNIQAIPLSKFNQILQTNNSPQLITDFLVENKIHIFYLKQSSASLPLKPTKELFQIANHLKIKRGYVTFIGLEKDNDIKQEGICAFFNIPYIPNQQLWNAVIVYFFESFFVIEKNFS